MNISRRLGLSLGAAVLLVWGAWLFLRPAPRHWEVPAQPITKILVIGDSLTTGYGLEDVQLSYPNSLARRCGLPVKVFGRPGCTCPGGADLVAAAAQECDASTLVILTLGGNDILRQVAPEQTLQHLSLHVQKLRQTGAHVIYTQVQSPFPSRRRELINDFCRQQRLFQIEDFLDGFFNNDKLMQADGIHPTPAGCQALASLLHRELQHAGFLPPTP